MWAMPERAQKEMSLISIDTFQVFFVKGRGSSHGYSMKPRGNRIAGTTAVLTAVFGAGRFDELAGWTGDSRVKQPPVIRIDVQLAGDFLLCHCAYQIVSREERVEKK